MTRETKARIIEYVILFALLAALLWCAIAGSIVGARNRAEAERDRYFRGATHSVPAMAFIEGPGNPEEWTEDQWAEFVAMYATATPQEREARVAGIGTRGFMETTPPPNSAPSSAWRSS